MKNLKKIFPNNPIPIDSPEAMRELGVTIAKYLEPRDVIGLVGELGAGKTHLVQGILRGLGSKEHAVSPTFSLVHEYECDEISLAHFDFYRMANHIEALSLGWQDYLDSSRILLVEWADKFEGNLMPSDTLWIAIKYNDLQRRNVFIF